MLLVVFCIPMEAQTYLQEKRIYLVDVTKSLVGQGEIKTPNIFDQVKNNLIDAINEIEDPNTEIIVVPFTNKPHQAIMGRTSQKDSLVAILRDLKIKSGDTNIDDAWKSGVSYLDSSKVNYLFLLTDGLHNCGVTKEVFYSTLNEWDSIRKGKNIYSNYVMLTDNAVEQNIRSIAQQIPQMWSIQSLNIKAALIRTSLEQKSNIYENKTININFISNNSKVFVDDLGVQFSIQENPFYSLTPTIKNAQNQGLYSFDIIEKQDRMNIPIDTTLTLHINFNNAKYPLVFFTPEDIDYRIINRGVRRMTLKVVE